MNIYKQELLDALIEVKRTAILYNQEYKKFAHPIPKSDWGFDPQFGICSAVSRYYCFVNKIDDRRIYDLSGLFYGWEFHSGDSEYPVHNADEFHVKANLWVDCDEWDSFTKRISLLNHMINKTQNEPIFSCESN